MEVSNPAPAEIRYISTDAIKPATRAASTERVELTPWDLKLLSKAPIKYGLLFYKPKQEMWLTHLKTSLSRTLDHFFPLAGRLATETHEDNTVSVYIQSNNAGAGFTHAMADLTVRDFLDTCYFLPHTWNGFFALNGTKGYDGHSTPLLSVQVTELIDGIFIACSINHAIADGHSFWLFVNSWSEICKTGSDVISAVPNFDRGGFFKDTTFPIRMSASILEEPIRSRPSLPLVEERVFHFAPQNIAKLKAKANLENKNSDKVVSSLQALLAHVWISVTRVMNTDADQPVLFMVPVGNRARLNPPLPQEYFGNSNLTTPVFTKAGELLNGGLGFAAGLLNTYVGLSTDSKIRGDWETWLGAPAIYGMEVPDGLIALIAAGSPKFNMYGNDFGWGPVVRVRSGFSTLKGRMILYPGSVKGSIDIGACLPLETLKGMAEDSEFMEFVGVVEAMECYNDGRFPGGPSTLQVVEDRKRHKCHRIWNGDGDYKKKISTRYHGQVQYKMMSEENNARR